MRCWSVLGATRLSAQFGDGVLQAALAGTVLFNPQRATDPVAVAASNNPMLTQLVAAVSGQLNPEVDLVDTLNGD